MRIKDISKLQLPIFFLLISVLWGSCSTGSKKKKSLTVFAAASLTDVMSKLADDYKKATGVSLRLNFASSGVLARQIEGGADYDYYISASKSWMTYIDSLKLVDRESVKTLAYNRMVAIVPIENKDFKLDSTNISNFPDLFKGRISIGDPAHVPAGKYAMQIIRKNNWQDNLESRYLPAKDVRDALFMVEMGEVEMGMVYSSDAQKSKKVRVIYEFPVEDCERISYFGAANSKETPELKKFQEYMNTNKAVWVNHGFKLE